MFDSHVHIIDPRFPLVSNGGYEPPVFTADDYREETDGLGVVGGAVIAGSFQGSDQSFLLAALTELGDGWVGVTHLPWDAEDAMPYLLDLVDRGARVKAAGFGRIGHDPVEAMSRIHAVNPEALMFGTDLPGTRSPRRFVPSDIDLVTEAVGGDLQKVLFRNARAWYRER